MCSACAYRMCVTHVCSLALFRLSLAPRIFSPSRPLCRRVWVCVCVYLCLLFFPGLPLPPSLLRFLLARPMRSADMRPLRTHTGSTGFCLQIWPHIHPNRAQIWSSPAVVWSTRPTLSEGGPNLTDMCQTLVNRVESRATLAFCGGGWGWGVGGWGVRLGPTCETMWCSRAKSASPSSARGVVGWALLFSRLLLYVWFLAGARALWRSGGPRLQPFLSRFVLAGSALGASKGSVPGHVFLWSIA